MVCSSCGGEVPPGARFCPHCGTQQSVGDEERRVVTVLFADIVGFTGLAETLDPENVKHLVDRCFERLAADIVAFGGVVDKILGDGMVALFGAPVAHEDDAERAVRAALRMQQTMASLAASSDVQLQLRIGINTGVVLVGMSSAGGDYTAMGDVMNLASRLEELAGPGRVLVGAATHAATVEAISYRSLGVVEARGRDGAVEAWIALSPIRPPGARSRRSVPFVGRTAELAAIEAQAALSIKRARAHAVLVVGEAGMGKTRLVQEATARIATAHGARVIEGRSVPYGEANLWWPVAEVLRQVFSIEIDAPPDHAKFVLDAGLKAHMGDTPAADRRRYATALLHALGYETSLRGGARETNRAEVMLAFTALLQIELTRRPVVLIMSDVHHAAEGVRLLLRHLLNELVRCPFILVMSAKETGAPLMPEGRHGSLVLPLAPLSDSAALAMLDEFGLELNAEEREQLIERSGGNPFFLEELADLVKKRSGVASAVGSGDDLSSLPDSLRGIIAARLDALDPQLRSLLEAAAVFGPNGPISGLARLALVQLQIEDIDPLMDELVQADLLVIDGHRYEFRSDLVRDIAYATLTKSGRALTHHGIASYLESRDGLTQRLAIVLTIARHYAAAHELLNDLGGTEGLDPEQVKERAIHWLNEAANRSLDAGAPIEAEHWYTLGVDLADDADTRANFLYGRARARSEIRDLSGARSDLEDIATFAEPDPMLVARVLLEHGELDRKRGDLDRAVQRLSDAAVQLRDLGDTEKEALALRLLGLSEMGRGDIRLARSALETSRAVACDSKDRRSEGWALQGLAMVAYRFGDLRDASELVEQAVDIFGELDDAGGVAWARSVDAWVSFHSGDRLRARALLDEIGPEVKRRGDPWVRAVMLNLSASVDLWSGEIEAAIASAREAQVLAQRAEDPSIEVQAMSLAGRALVASGQLSEGRQVLDSAFNQAERVRHKQAARTAVVANAGTAALLGEADAVVRWAAYFESETPDPEMLGETELSVALALAMLQRGAVDTAAEQLSWLDHVPDDTNMYARSVDAIVAAAQGDPQSALRRAEQVTTSAASTYLDACFAHLAQAAVHRQQNDEVACELALASAKAVVAGTQDAVMPRIIAMAEAVDGFGHLAHTEIQFRGLDIDPSGWRRAWQTAASGGQLKTG